MKTGVFIRFFVNNDFNQRTTSHFNIYFRKIDAKQTTIVSHFQRRYHSGEATVGLPPPCAAEAWALGHWGECTLPPPKLWYLPNLLGRSWPSCMPYLGCESAAVADCLDPKDLKQVKTSSGNYAYLLQPCQPLVVCDTTTNIHHWSQLVKMV